MVMQSRNRWLSHNNIICPQLRSDTIPDDTIQQYENSDEALSFEDLIYYPGLRESILHTAGNLAVLYEYNTDYACSATLAFVSRCQNDNCLTYCEALSWEKNHIWPASMRNEIKSFQETRCWEIVQLRESLEAVRTKWV